MNVSNSKIEGKNANSLQFIGLYNDMFRVRNLYPGAKDFTSHKKFHCGKKILGNKIHILCIFHSSQ